MKHEEIELHDANLKSTTVDYVSQTVVLEIDYHLFSEQGRSRIAASFKFSGVSTYNENSSIDELKKHSIFGNISSWIPAFELGTTYIYLARGFISITAMELEVINHA